MYHTENIQKFFSSLKFMIQWRTVRYNGTQCLVHVHWGTMRYSAGQCPVQWRMLGIVEVSRTVPWRTVGYRAGQKKCTVGYNGVQ